MLKKIDTRRIGAHILFWVLYIVFEIVFLGWKNPDFLDFAATRELLTDIPMMVVVVYINLYFLMPRFFYTGKYFQYGFYMLVLLLIAACYLRASAYFIWSPLEQREHPQNHVQAPADFFIPNKIIRDTFYFYLVVALTMLVKVLRNSYKREKLMREMENEKFNAEKSFLKAQIHPHFFFNTLSILYSLTLNKSEKAPDIVLQLSELMHYVLYEANSNFVLLDKDINHLKNYIDIGKMRFTDRLELSFQYSGQTTGKLIAPLILLTFVENAFKHSLHNEIEKAWITIDIKVTDTMLFFKAENSFRKINETKMPGSIGLQNVKRRLQLSYPNRHELILKEKDNVFYADLKIHLSE